MTDLRERLAGGFASAKATTAASLRYSGRATRSEVGSYVLTAWLFSVVYALLAGQLLPDRSLPLAGNLLPVLISIPVPALLVRRYHDSGRSGSWVWLAVLVFAIWAARTVVAATLGVDARLQLDRATGLIDWVVILANLVSVILVLLPGNPGPNRFGDDPRGRG